MNTEAHSKEAKLTLAAEVDGQTASDPSYEPMISDSQPTGHAFGAAMQLVMNGVLEPSGYTEPGLHQSRLDHKAD